MGSRWAMLFERISIIWISLSTETVVASRKSIDARDADMLLGLGSFIFRLWNWYAMCVHFHESTTFFSETLTFMNIYRLKVYMRKRERIEKDWKKFVKYRETRDFPGLVMVNYSSKVQRMGALSGQSIIERSLMLHVVEKVSQLMTMT